jgi:hypothetical protein
VEDRLEEIQQALDLLKSKSDEQGGLLRSNVAEGLSQWNTFNSELRKIKEEIKESRGGMEYFQDVVYTQFKDPANTTGDFGNIISTLEASVKKIMEKLNIK